MILRRILALIALSLCGPSLAAQQSIPLMDSVLMTVDYAAPQMLSAFPAGWRDSVVAAWIAHVPPDAVRALPRVTEGTTVHLVLQLLRNGDLRRARLSNSTGTAALDSLLIQTSWITDRALAYPKFPPGVEGAGTEVTL